MGGIDEDWPWFLVLGPQIGYCKCGACFVASGKAPSIFQSVDSQRPGWRNAKNGRCETSGWVENVGDIATPQKKMLKKLTKLWGQLYHPGNNSCSIFLGGYPPLRRRFDHCSVSHGRLHVRSRWASIASISRWNVWEPRDGQQPMVRWIWGHGNAPNPKV